MLSPTYVVISPVRDEGKNISKTIESMSQQTVLPEKWIIVNDGSTDQTGEIIDAASKKYAWVQPVHRPNRGFRKAGGGVIEAFYDGYSSLGDRRWDFIVKLDGDLSFPADYFAKCFSHFACEPCLGLGGGTVCVLRNGQLIVEAAHDPPFHVRGATKIYSRTCWEKISPLVTAPGWDTIDELKANMYGWTSRTFTDIKLLQLKGTGSADGDWRNWFKNGLGSYLTGYHPIFMMGKCIKRAFGRPSLVASLGLWAGFCSGYLKRLPRVPEGEVIRYLRRQQVCRIMGRPSIYSRSATQ